MSEQQKYKYSDIVSQAMERGYTIDEIADKLGAQSGLDPSAIRERGYASDEILAKLGHSSIAETAPPAEPTEFGASDIGNALQVGYGSAAQGIGWGLKKVGAEDLGKSIQDYWNNYTKEQTAQYSDEAKAAKAKDMSIDDIGSTLIKIATGTTESLPAMVLGMPLGAGVGAALTKTAQILYGAGRGGSAMAYASGAASPLTRTGGIAAQAPASIGASIGEGGMAGITNGAQMKQSIDEMPVEKLRKAPAYVALLNQLSDIKDVGEREAKARDLLGDAMSSEYALKTFASTALLGAAFGGGVAGQIIGRDAARRAGTDLGEGFIKRGVKGGLGEFAQEAPQSGAEKLISNVMTQENINPSQGTWDGVVRQSIEGGLTGLALGGVMGAADIQPTNKAAAIHGEIERIRQQNYVNGITPDTQQNAEVASAINDINDQQAVADITSPDIESVDQAVAVANAAVEETPIETPDSVAQAKAALDPEYAARQKTLDELTSLAGTDVSPASEVPVQGEQPAQPSDVSSIPSSAFGGDMVSGLDRIFQSDAYDGSPVPLVNTGFTQDEIKSLESAGLASNGYISLKQYGEYTNEYARRNRPTGITQTNLGAGVTVSPEQQSMAQPADTSSMQPSAVVAPPNSSRVAQTNKQAQNVAPLGENHESSIAVKALENSMQASSETRGTKIVAVAYPVRDLSSPEAPTARDRSWDLTKKIQNIFGINVITTRQVGGNGKFGFNGVYLRPTNKIYLNVDTQKPAHAVFGHEFIHHLKVNNQEAYNDLVAVLRPMVKDLAAFKGKEGLPSDMEDAVVIEELLGNVSGNRFVESTFWKEVADKSPSHFKVIVKTILDLIDKIQAKLGDAPAFRGDEFITDVPKMRTALAEAVAYYNRTNPNNRIDMSAMGGPKFARKEQAGKEERNPEKSREAASDKMIDPSKVKTVSFKSLIGRIVFPTIADRTAAGGSYEGIDSTKVDGDPLQGGPNFPLLTRNFDKNVVWANNGKGVMGRKANLIEKHGRPIMAVALGSLDMHASNATAIRQYIKTLEAYIMDGRVKKAALPILTDRIRALKIDADVNRGEDAYELAGFVGFKNTDALHLWIENASFGARRAIVEEMSKARNEELGVPIVDKVMAKLLDKEYAGARDLDAVLLIEPHEDDTFVTLGEDGTDQHLSYKYGVKGKLIGKLKNPINAREIWKEWWATQYQSKLDEKQRIYDAYTSGDKSGLSKEDNSQYVKVVSSKAKLEQLLKKDFDALINMERAFQLSTPAVEITPELAAHLESLSEDKLPSASTAKAVVSFASDTWASSDGAVNVGGISPADWARELLTSDYSATLDHYSEKELKRLIKRKELKLFQLGGNSKSKQGQRIIFALKYGKPELYGQTVEGVTDNEVSLKSVVNNEQGVSGIAGAAIVLKAIKEGATFLDCYAHVSKKYPDGFLPEFYREFGFEPVEINGKTDGIEFDKTFLTEEHKYAWANDGWKEGDPLPKIVLMKWKGNENDRARIIENFIREGAESLHRDKPSGAAERVVGEVGRQSAKTESSKSNPRDRDSGNQGNGDRASVASRAHGVIQLVKGLSKDQLRNLGIDSSAIKFSRASNSERLRVSPEEVTTEYGELNEDATTVIGLHYSSQERRTLSSVAYGTGLKGAESARVQGDPILSKRIHFYVDEDKGIRPESGVGGYVHAVKLNNLYDVNKDPLGFRRDARGSMNAIERMSYDAGFDGVYVSGAQGEQGVAVLIGRHTVAPTPLGTHAMAATGSYAPTVTTLSKGLMSAEIARFEKDGIPDAPSAKLVSGTLKYSPEDTDAVDAFLGVRKAIPEIVDLKEIPKSLKIRLETEVDGKIVSKTVGAQRALLAAEQNVARLEALKRCVG